MVGIGEKPVDDGDTVNVDIKGDLTARRSKVRLTGIQAMELRSYSRFYGRTGECHSIEATERLEGLVRKSRNRVRLAAMRPTSITGARGRLRRGSTEGGFRTRFHQRRIGR